MILSPRSSRRSNGKNLYDALSHSVGDFPDHEPRNIYRSGGNPSSGFVSVKSKIKGFSGEDFTNKFEIAYTKWGNKGPVVLFLHGVPANRSSYLHIQKRLSPFCRTVAIDMLGMGESSKPLMYGKGQDMEDLGFPEGTKPWDWITDVDIIDQAMQKLYPGEKFIFFADDWGAGQCMHYAAKYNDKRLLAMCLLDPIAFDGYPVSEIQAIGRASAIEDDNMFMMAMGAIDQTMVQIFKTMVHNPDKVYNQYTLRDIKKTYIDTDYERSARKYGEDATSMTLRLKWKAIRVLADRAAILSPALLLPYHPTKNPKGVKFSNITVPVLVEWGQFDNMMPPAQLYRFQHALHKSRVEIHMVPDAGHFAGIDNPDDVSATLLNFLHRELGKDSLADVFLGFCGMLWKGDEEMMIKDLRMIFGK